MSEWYGAKAAIEVDTAGEIGRELVDKVKLSAIERFERLFALCRTHRLRGADATYLDLSIAQGAALLTGDRKLAAAAHSAGVKLVYDPNA